VSIVRCSIGRFHSHHGLWFIHHPSIFDTLLTQRMIPPRL
jgi:hypothetical protein